MRKALYYPTPFWICRSPLAVYILRWADDDGFVGSPKAIMRQCGASQDDMNVLLSKRYVLGFESGVIVIKHWRMNNYLRSDRYHDTTYLEEKETLIIDERGAYTEKDKSAFGIPVSEKRLPSGIPCDDRRYTDTGDTEVRLDKDSIDYISPGGDIAADAASSASAEQSNKVDFSFSSASAEQPTQNSYSAPSASPNMDKGDISDNMPRVDKTDAFATMPRANKPNVRANAAPRAYNPDTFFEMPKAGEDAPRFDNLVPEEYTKDPQWQNYLTDARESLRRMFGAPKPPKKPDTKPRYGSFDPEEAMAIAIARTEYEFDKTDKNKSS